MNANTEVREAALALRAAPNGRLVSVTSGAAFYGAKCGLTRMTSSQAQSSLRACSVEVPRHARK
jgi:hypothetical protein